MENTFFTTSDPTTVAEDVNANVVTTTTNTNANTTNSDMGCVPYSHYANFESMNFSSSTLPPTLPQQCYFPAQYVQPPHLQTPQFPCLYPVNQAGQPFAAYPVSPSWFGQNGVENGAAPGNNGFWQPNGLTTKEHQRGFLDPQRTKIARIKRKLARQKALSLQKNASGSSSVAASSTQADTRRLVMYGGHNLDLFNFCTPDNKRLRVLLKKQLKNSDVGSLGRIVLPKREAEENLPSLSDKEGIQIVMRDVFSDQLWTLKFKYWSNNKSRMYVLENTGDFVKQNGMEIGDSLTLYEDESRNFYFSIEKVEKPVAEPSNKQDSANNNNKKQTYNCLNTPPPQLTNHARDEEEASLAFLIQQLDHKEQQEANYNFMTSPVDYAASSSQRLQILPHDDQEANVDGPCTLNNITHDHLGRIHPHLVATVVQPASYSNGRMRLGVDDDNQSNSNNTTDDCYGGLDMLPDVNKYNFSL
ncbi:hypothetical protein ACOSQ4_012122 [Xanthoceras sorbifolium]